MLAAYNGEKFIEAQLDSIINQTYTNWQLFIRDDGSRDKTINIIQQYLQKDARIHLIKDATGNLGSVQNFNALFQQKKNAVYIMFADQDDVWLPSKITDTLNAMLKLEQQYSTNIPLLLHTNFLYVDVALQPIQSKINYEATKIKSPVLANVLCQNSVYGCTMMINQKLAELTADIPVVAENHDYWFALVSSAFGKIIYLPERTILYRQHGNNASTQHDFNSFSKRFKRIFLDRKNVDDVQSKIKMATVFKERYYSILSLGNKKVVDDFIKLSNKRTLPLLVKNFRHGVRRQTVNQTMLFYLTLLLSKSNKFTYSMALLLIMFTAL